ncbi:hypothetical protein SEA_SHAM_73 [Streptomyces phage Sham]|nr:hypothetical protein SEA_SHAM_73 [Streptomyces phage Sham]
MATSAKKYHSKKWLYKRYILENKSIEEIAGECKVSLMTIQRYLKKFEITKRK